MDSAPAALHRDMAAMAGNSRPRDFSAALSLKPNAANSDHSSHPSPWNKSIWNSNPIGLSFVSAARDTSHPLAIPAQRGHPPSSRSTDSATEPPSASAARTGSGSLVAHSNTEWQPNRLSWGEVSPAPTQSLVHAQPCQPLADNAPSAFFPISRASMGQGLVTKPAQQLSEFSPLHMHSSRQVESLNSAFSNFTFAQPDAAATAAAGAGQRPDTAVTSWPDAASIYALSDDRPNVANADYLAPSSGAPSRSGSLPPSRHGAESAQYSQSTDAFSRFSQTGLRHTASLSVAGGRVFQERSSSLSSDSLHALNRLALEQEQDARMAVHRSSASINGFTTPTFPPTGQESAAMRESFPHTQPSTKAAHEEGGYRATGTHTPNGYGNSYTSDSNAPLRAGHLDSSRSAPNGTDVRQSPFYSTIHTPPIHDHPHPHPHPHRYEQTLSHPNNIVQLQNKLAGYQMQQEQRRNVKPANHLHQRPYQQHTLPANQLRHGYGYQFGVPAGMQLTAIPPHLSMNSMASLMPMPPLQSHSPLQPRGSREQSVAGGDGLAVMSDVLANFKREQKQSKRWELSDIYTHVVEFAGDQHGSRFIQQKLETANSEVKERVFNELVNDALPLMQDVFGNYVIQKFFEHGDQTQKKVLAAKMKGHVLALANQMYACRVVQKALEHVLTDQQAVLVKELEKDVVRTVKDQNGNHVIQKIVDRVPLEHIQTIVEAFRGQVGALSLNAYGCRVIQRLLEKVQEPQRRFILHELHAEGARLITDAYGNYVTQHVIEHGLPEDRAKVVVLVMAHLLPFSKHKFASNVVERCLVCGDDAQRRQLVSTMTAPSEHGESNLLILLKDGYGNYVLQKMLDTLSRDDFHTFVVALKPELEKAKKMISGKQITSVEKKMYRFDRMDSPVLPRDDAPPTPALTSSAQSPQSSSLPSTNASTIDDPVHRSRSISKEGSASPHQVEVSQ